MLPGIWLKREERIVHFPAEGLRHDFSASAEISSKQSLDASIQFQSHPSMLMRAIKLKLHSDLWKRGKKEWLAFVLFHQQIRW